MENEEKDKNIPQLNEEKTLLEEYQKLKENSVSKEKYDKDIAELKEKNQIYLKAITEGGKVDTPTENSGSLKEAISNMSKFKGTNLEYWKNMTATIDKVLKEVPEKEITSIAGSEGLDEIIKVNSMMKNMVEKANGDPDYFRTLYNNTIKDSAPKISADIEKSGSLVNYLIQQNKK